MTTMPNRMKVLFRASRPVRLFIRVVMAGICLFSLFACATLDRAQESARHPGTAEELARDVAAAGIAYKLLLPTGSDLILLGLTYVIYDPLAPNWEIETVRASEDIFRMQLTLKRFHSGGEGEAQYLFRRNARRIAQAAGYDDYRILRYEESVESAAFASHRFGEGEIRLLKAQ
ncbi:MAG: hypothetical protein LBD68_08395 [Zoogloeaceae bacterium]|nr:hypothetical protein [Zoogloeaceae bacterium]